MRQVAGFPCPECRQDELADIVEVGNDFRVLELSCPECGKVWVTEL